MIKDVRTFLPPLDERGYFANTLLDNIKRASVITDAEKRFVIARELLRSDENIQHSKWFWDFICMYLLSFFLSWFIFFNFFISTYSSRHSLCSAASWFIRLRHAISEYVSTKSRHWFSLSNHALLRPLVVAR